MKFKMFILLLLGFMFYMSSCKKDEPKASEEELTVTAEGAISISSGVQSFILNTMTVAADSGFYTDVPELPSKKNNVVSGKGTGDYSWTGPDSDGWYTRRISGLYDYYEKIKLGDTIDYIMKISYSGADGSYENTTTTHFAKFTKDGVELYKGFSRWEVSASGYSDISRFEWKITFDDWNPESSAGIYDWYWGVSENSGGDTVPFYRFEHLVATETDNDWLNCHVTFYDEGNIEIWDFEYDSPWAPVEMPELPQL
jgi:hypothetical protein